MRGNAGGIQCCVVKGKVTEVALQARQDQSVTLVMYAHEDRVPHAWTGGRGRAVELAEHLKASRITNAGPPGTFQPPAGAMLLAQEQRCLNQLLHVAQPGYQIENLGY